MVSLFSLQGLLNKNNRVELLNMWGNQYLKCNARLLNSLALTAAQGYLLALQWVVAQGYFLRDVDG